MLDFAWTGCGRAFGPKLRVDHCILRTGIYYTRRGRRDRAGCWHLACHDPRRPANSRRIPVPNACVTSLWNVGQLDPLDAHRHISPPHGSEAAQVGFLAARNEACRVQHARRIPLPNQRRGCRLTVPPSPLLSCAHLRQVHVRPVGKVHHAAPPRVGRVSSRTEWCDASKYGMCSSPRTN